MPIWKLTPTNIKDIAWRASTYTGTVLVRAVDEPHARRLAATALRMQVDARLVQHTRGPTPWTDPQLVHCVREHQSIYLEEGPAKMLWPEAVAVDTPATAKFR